MEIKIQSDSLIVMVDDSEIDAMLMQRLVEKSELENEFMAFHSGVKFLEFMNGVTDDSSVMPAIVFLDINMPHLSGYEVLSELRNHPEFDTLPIVVFLTNSNSPSDIERCQSLNVAMQEKFFDTTEGVAYLNSLLP